MKYIDERALKENEVVAEVGDFIHADGELFVIYKNWAYAESKYQAIYVLGSDAFDGAGATKVSIEELIAYFKQWEDFELIKSDEMKLVREV